MRVHRHDEVVAAYGLQNEVGVVPGEPGSEAFLTGALSFVDPDVAVLLDEEFIPADEDARVFVLFEVPGPPIVTIEVADFGPYIVDLGVLALLSPNDVGELL